MKIQYDIKKTLQNYIVINGKPVEQQKLSIRIVKQ